MGSDSKVGVSMLSQVHFDSMGQRSLLICDKLQYTRKKDNILLWQELFDEKTGIYPSDVKKALIELSDEFENIVLDSGHDYHEALLIGTLENADINVVVTTQQRSALTGLKSFNDEVLVPMEKRVNLIVNKYVEDAYTRADEIKSMGEFEKTFTIRYSPFGWDAEQQEQTLMSAMGFNKDFRKYEKRIQSI